MKKILVIQTAFPGDAILTLPLIQSLKKLNDIGVVDVLAIPATNDIFTYSNSVNSVIVYDKKNSEKSFSSFMKMLSKIRRNKYDAVYSPHRSARSILISYFSGAAERIGFDKAALSFLLTKKVKYNSKDHEVKRNLSLVESFNIANWKVLPEIKNSDIPEGILLANENAKLVAIAPGSVWETKKYPIGYYKEIVQVMINQKIGVILIGGKEDYDLCEELNLQPEQSTFNLAGKVSIPQSITLLKKCDVLVSNDSAPTHMGVSANIPVITIYCSTIPEFGFYPYNHGSTTISYEGLKCKPCGIHGHNSCPEKSFDCALKLEPATIIEKINSLLT